MSAGFWIVLLAELLLVVVPSMLLLSAVFRASRAARGAAALGTALVVLLGLFALAGDGERTPMADRLVGFFAGWGFLLCLFVAVAVIGALVRKVLSLRARS